MRFTIKMVGQVLRVVNSDRKRFLLTLTEYRVFVEWLTYAPDYHPTTVQIGQQLQVAQSHVSTAFRSLVKKEVLQRVGKGDVGQSMYQLHDTVALIAGLKVPLEKDPNRYKGLKDNS